MTDITKVKVTMGGGRPIAYKCEYHEETGRISNETAKEVPAYYDILYPCNSSIDESMSIIANNLLTDISTKYQIIPSGKSCSIPDTTLPVWLLGVSSDPIDTLTPDLSCQKLTPNGAGQCCSVVYAPMTMWPTGNNYGPQDLMSLVAEAVDSPNATAGTDFKIAYIGSVIDPSLTGGGKNAIPVPDVPPAISTPEESTSKAKTSNSLTVVGGVFLGGLAAVFVGGFFVLVKRRRRRLSTRDIQVAAIKSDADAEDGQSDGPTLEVDVMSDDMPTYHSNNRDYDAQDDYHPSSYTFDLANTLKNDVMGTYGLNTYGPTSISVVPPYPMAEETSDSEVDSWAQTDGTVGSLEERLEEITAEI